MENQPVVEFEDLAFYLYAECGIDYKRSLTLAEKIMEFLRRTNEGQDSRTS